MSATYKVSGLGDPGYGLIAAMAGIDPGRDSGPNVNLHVNFPNGVILSLVWGWGAYASPSTVEVAVIRDSDGEWITGEIAELIFNEGIDDVVDGYCDAERVHAYFLAAQGWKP